MRKHPLAALLGAAISHGAFAQFTGPSSSATPYNTSTAAGWTITSLLTVGDSVNTKPDGTPYRLVGIPDGIGAYDNGNGTFTVLTNHEIGATAGISRAHGAAGAFVSEWVIRKSDLRVLNGADLAQRHLVSTGNESWTLATGAANSFGRLCSADLPAVSAFYNPLTGKGTESRIFMNGEEVGSEGRAYGFVASGPNKGSAYQLPALGRFSWENSLANPYAGDKTVVIGTDDSTPGQVYLYVGDKKAVGNDVVRAGLTGGQLYGFKTNTPRENTNTPVAGAFSAAPLTKNQWNDTGAALDTESVAAGVTNFARPEDGHWADRRTFYFTTTGATVDGTAVRAKLYKMTFAEGAGGVDYTSGSIDMELDSGDVVGLDGAAPVIPGWDNITVDGLGRIVLQDDPGNNAYNAKTWIHDPRNPVLRNGKKVPVQIFESDVARFGRSGTNPLPATGPFNVDEENSGIVDITDVMGRNDGTRYYLGVMQAHYGIAGELVEGGQMYLISQVPEPETYALMLGGLGLVAFMARRRVAKHLRH
jgi:Bacterial protein of unknown function (DUF839)/PEP-CTERM motif